MKQKVVPLGLAILTPVIAGILAFALKPVAKKRVGVLLAVIHAGLLWNYRNSFSGLFQRNVSAN